MCERVRREREREKNKKRKRECVKERERGQERERGEGMCVRKSGEREEEKLKVVRKYNSDTQNEQGDVCEHKGVNMYACIVLFLTVFIVLL